MPQVTIRKHVARCVRSAPSTSLRSFSSALGAPGNRGGVDKVLAHLGKEAHAGDAEAAAAIEALMGRCGVCREAQTRNGRAIRSARPTADQVPRLVAEFQNSSKIWS